MSFGTMILLLHPIECVSFSRSIIYYHYYREKPWFSWMRTKRHGSACPSTNMCSTFVIRFLENILLYNKVKRPIFIGFERSRGQSIYCHIHWLVRACQWILVTKIRLEELPPILRPRRIRLRVFVTSFKRKNDVTPSNAMNDVIFQ